MVFASLIYDGGDSIRRNSRLYKLLCSDVSRYLRRVHAAIAEVFHMIGGGEDIDVFHDSEPITRLAGDG
jgi:hypothetical protein